MEIRRRKVKANQPSQQPHQDLSSVPPKKRKTQSKPLPEATMIKPVSGKTIVELLSQIYCNDSHADSNSDVESLRKTRWGYILVEVLELRAKPSLVTIYVLLWASLPRSAVWNLKRM